MKRRIAIPTLDFVHVEFLKSLLKLIDQLKSEGIPYEVKILNGTLVYLAREELAIVNVVQEDYYNFYGGPWTRVE